MERDYTDYESFGNGYTSGVNEPKIVISDGEIVKLLEANEIYLALWYKDKMWFLSGVMYRRIDEIAGNLANFEPERILVVRVNIPYD